LFSLATAQLLTECQVATYLRQYGFPESDVPKLTCAAYYESSRRCNAQGATNRDGSVDYGILQVNSNYWCQLPGAPGRGCGVTCAAIKASCDAGFKCAKKVYDAQGLTAWYGYSGHRTTCNAYRLPSSCSSGGGVAVASSPAASASGADCEANNVGGSCTLQHDCDGSWLSSSSSVTGCESEPNNVRCCTSGPTSADAPPCTYYGRSGSCLDINGGECFGSFRSHSQGADGCQSLANNIKCCLSASNLVDDVNQDYVSSVTDSGANLPVIIGAVVAAVLVIALVVGLAIFFVLRSKKSSHIEYSNPTFTTVVPPPRPATPE